MRKTIFIIILSLSLFSCASTNNYALKEEALRRYPVNHPFPESVFVKVDGARLHVRQWKPSQANFAKPKGVVFLVHGVSGSTYNWRFLAPALAKAGWNVLTADLPPFGFSGEKQENGVSLDPLPEDSISRAMLLWDLFDEMYKNYSGSVVLIGHSLGGRISTFMTLSKPERVQKLVLIAPAVYGSSAIPSITKYWPFNQIAIFEAKNALENIDVVRMVLNRAYGEKVNNDDLLGNWAPFLREGVPAACGDWAIRAIDTVEPRVRSLTVPTLILWSTNDSVVSNKGYQLQSQIIYSRYIEIPGGSHCLMDTDNDSIGPAIIEFISDSM